MVSFVDLGAQYQEIQHEIEAAVLKTLRSGQYILGPNVYLLEANLQKFLGCKHVITCSSGTDALLMALMAKGVGPGKVVFTTPFTFIATAEVIARLGALPVFVDVEPNSYNLDPLALKQAIEAVLYQDSKRYPIPKILKNTTQKWTPAGIIAVDLFGLPCDYQAINRIAFKHGLFVIEDAAQSFGGTFWGKKAGTLAEIGCTSFYPAKPLGAYGDGGAICCQDDLLAKKIRSIRVHGESDHPYKHAQLGLTGRLDELQACILNEKLKIFEKEALKRKLVAHWYQQALKTLPEITLPTEPIGSQSAWALYPIKLKNQLKRDELKMHLKVHNLPSVVYYPIALHQQGVFSHLDYHKNDFPIARDLSETLLALPMHPYLSENQVLKVTDCVKTLFMKESALL